ncbi:MAG: SCO family protein [Rhodobacteraceae bacterium]|nr:SCO family protein [Paracoccaceae bacterium]
MISRRAFITYLGAGTALLGGVLALGWWQVDGPGADRPLPAALPLPLSEMSFAMQDHTGADVSPQGLVGKPSLVFFGYTFCPDVCPATLSDISRWLSELGPDAAQLNTVFITVDPARDTQKAMAQYMGYFDPAIRGWRGSLAETDKAVAGFRASYELGEGPDYAVNHTSSVFLFQADGRFAATLDLHEDPAQALAKIRRVME